MVRTCRAAIAASITAVGLLVLWWAVPLQPTAGVVDSPSTPAPPPPADPGQCADQDVSAQVLCQVASGLGTIRSVPAVPGLPSLQTRREPSQPPTRAGGSPGTAPGDPSGPSPSDAATSSPANAAEIQSLLDVLSHPLGDLRGDLRHFHPGGAGDGPSPATAVRVSPRVRLPARGNHAEGHRVLAWWLLVGPFVVGVALIAGRRALRAPASDPPRRRRLRLSGLLVGVVAAVGSELAGAALAMAAPHPRDPLGAATSLPIVLSQVPRPVETTASDPGRIMAWDRLLRLEKSLAVYRDRLAATENEMREIVGVGSVGGSAGVMQTSRLDWLLESHQVALTAYRQSLENEYLLYRQAAEDPQVRAQLLRGAGGHADGRAAAAIAYNLQLIDTLLAQERAIARAEAKLARDGWWPGVRHPGSANDLRFIPPEVAPITQGFGPTDFTMEPPLRYEGVFYPHFHTGIDLAAPLGTPLHAAEDGLVLLATASRDAGGHFVGYGNYVVLAHTDGFVTLYGHLSRILVHAGSVVRQGDIVGLEGSTGWSTGPHVHFEIRDGQGLIDPLTMLGPFSGSG